MAPELCAPAAISRTRVLTTALLTSILACALAMTHENCPITTHRASCFGSLDLPASRTRHAQTTRRSLDFLFCRLCLCLSAESAFISSCVVLSLCSSMHFTCFCPRVPSSPKLKTRGCGKLVDLCLLLLFPPPSTLKTQGCGKVVDLSLLLLRAPPPKLKTRGCGKLVDLCLPLPRPPFPPNQGPEVAGNLSTCAFFCPAPSPQTKDPRLRETCRLCLPLICAAPPELVTRGCGKLVDRAFFFPALRPPN